MTSAACFVISLFPLFFTVGTLFGATKRIDHDENDVAIACILALVVMVGFLGAGAALKSVGQ